VEPGQTEIELHDSTITGARMDGGELVLSVHAIVHVGEVGRITTWTQETEFRFEGASELPAVDEEGHIYDGKVTVGADVIENCLPVPFDRTGDARLTASGYNYGRGVEWKIEPRGQRLRIVLLGAPTFLEVFPFEPW
jgi:hypothetical protein